MQKCLQADPKVKGKDFSRGCIRNTQDADNSPETSPYAKIEHTDLQTQSASGNFKLRKRGT